MYSREPQGTKAPGPLPCGEDPEPDTVSVRRTELILASGSPRRAELLREIIPSFRIVPSDIQEDHAESEAPVAYALRVSREKAEEVSERVGCRKGGFWVLAGDTVVVVEGTVLGKPHDADHARWMLDQLQDRSHEVLTGICLLNRRQEVCCLEAVRTRVWMRRIEPEEREAYIRTAEPFDKAGGYAIQGFGGRFVLKIDGSLSNVIGLPTERLRTLFRKYGIR